MFDPATLRPQDLERRLLGTALELPEVIPLVDGLLGDDDWGNRENRDLWRLLRVAQGRGEPYDSLALGDALAASGKPGGEISQILIALDGSGTENSAPEYAKQIRAYAIRRRLVRAADRIRGLAYQPDTNLGELIGRAQGWLAGLEVCQGGGWRETPDLLLEWFERFDRERAEVAQGGTVGLQLGLSQLDHLLGGIRDGEVITIAGRPAMGKTALALCATVNVAVNQGRPVGIFSAEMSASQIMGRLLTLVGDVDASRVRRAVVDAREYDGLLRVGGSAIHDAPIYIDDRSRSLSAIRGAAVRLKARQPDLALWVVDYVQLLDGDGHGGETQKITALARGLQGIAKLINVPLLMLSQLNRGVEDRVDKRPMLRDLRGAGAIEEISDAVIACYRHEYYEPEDPACRGVAECNVLKQRAGRTGRAVLAWHGATMRWADAPPSQGY